MNMQEHKKISDDWERPDIQETVMLTGEKLDKLVAACEEYDRAHAELHARFDAVKEGFIAEAEAQSAKVSGVLEELLTGTPLEGKKAGELNVDTQYAKKFGQILVRPRVEQARDLGSMLRSLLGGRDEVDVLEIGGNNG